MDRSSSTPDEGDPLGANLIIRSLRGSVANMQAVDYRAQDGPEPVDEFVERLRDPNKQATLDNQIDRLNMLRPSDPPLPFPWSSQFEGELRCHYGSELYRVIYRCSLGRLHDADGC